MTPEEQAQYSRFGFGDPQSAIDRSLRQYNRATDPVVGQILQLLQEAKKGEYELPGPASLAWNHPGVLSYQIKTQPHYENDMRRGKFLSGVADMQRRDAEYMRQTGEQSAQIMNEAVGQAGRIIPGLQKAVDRRDEVASPYWNRGMLAHGQPARNGLDAMQAFASTSINAGRMLGAGMGIHGQTPEHSAQLTQQAADDFAKSADRLLLGLPSALDGRVDNPLQDAWEAERKNAGERPVESMAFAMDNPGSVRALPALSTMPYHLRASEGMTSGDNLSVPIFGDGLVGRGVGLGIDILTDPLSEGPAAIRNLLKGQWLRGAMGLGAEASVPAGMMVFTEAMRNEIEDRLKAR